MQLASKGLKVVDDALRKAELQCVPMAALLVILREGVEW
jgi:hypothetical protein